MIRLIVGEKKFNTLRYPIEKYTNISFVNVRLPSNSRSVNRIGINTQQEKVLAYRSGRSKNEYFINANGDQFKHVLEFTRNPDIEAYKTYISRQANPRQFKKDLKVAAQFYNVEQLQEFVDSHLNSRVGGMESQIIDCIDPNNPKEFEILNSWIPNKNPNDYTTVAYTLLYRASEHGFSASKFHELCDNKGPTVTIIETKAGYVCGGYTEISWTSPSSEQEAKDPNRRGFIFLLRSPKREQPSKWVIKSSYGEAWHNKDLGPCFRNYINLANSCNENESSCAWLGNYYEGVTNDTYGRLTEQRDFTVKEYEVWRVGNSNDDS